MANLKMITDNPVRKINQLTSIFNEFQWSFSHIKIRRIHQVFLEIWALKHQESQPFTF